MATEPGGDLVVLLLVLAGLAAGCLNGVVGSGSLVSFPTLIGFGVDPLSATITNSIGLTPSNFTGPWGYRRLLALQKRRLAVLVPVAVAGALTGSLLLTVLPATVFEVLVPWLVLVAVALVAAQPWLQAVVRARAPEGASIRRGQRVLLLVLMLLAAAYGGYFVAAQGIFMFAILGAFLGGDMAMINALKNALASLVNVVASTIYIVVAFDRIIWPFVAVLAIGSSVGGILGAMLGRRVPGRAFRWIIVVAGLIGFVVLVVE